MQERRDKRRFFHFIPLYRFTINCSGASETQWSEEARKGARGSRSLIVPRLFRPSLPNPSVSLRQRPPWRHCGAVGGEADASATNFCTTHFGRSARARWLCHLTHDLKQRLTCSSPLRARERLCNRAISARDAEAESKSLSPLPSPRKIARCREVYFPFRPFFRPTGVLSLPLSVPPHLFALTSRNRSI